MTPDALTIRPCRPGDQDEAKRLINAGLGERFGVVDESFNPDLDDIAAHYTAAGHVFVVAERAGTLAGTGCLMIEANGASGQMVRVSVRRELRGQGIGRALVAHLLAEARGRGLRRVWMETNEDWTSAIRLYEACGFRQYAHKDGLVFLEHRRDGKHAQRAAGAVDDLERRGDDEGAGGG
ncbi:MAG TPA: GNAT family N-acetyltransferase [Ktedonobacterales bacterium]|jgi:ribosomal protein S18 acetylase RimI-like enzyme